MQHTTSRTAAIAYYTCLFTRPSEHLLPYSAYVQGAQTPSQSHTSNLMSEFFLGSSKGSCGDHQIAVGNYQIDQMWYPADSLLGPLLYIGASCTALITIMVKRA